MQGIKKYRSYITCLIGIGIVTAFFLPFLFLDRVSDDGDLSNGFYQILDIYRDNLINNEQFLWTGRMLAGFPIYLDPSGGFFSPIQKFLFKSFETLTAYNFALAIATGLVFLFTFLFARENGISRAGSFASSIVFSFGYQNAYWSGNLNVVNAYFILPLLLYCISKINKGGRYLFWIFVGGLGVALAFLSGQPQWIIMACVGAGFYILNLVHISYKNGAKFSWKIIVGFILILILGLAFAYPQILSYQQATGFSARSEGLSYSAAQLSSFIPVDWVWYVFPGFHIKYLNTQEQNIYIGILPFILGIIGFMYFWKKGDLRPKYFIFLWLFGIVATLKYSPVFWMIHQLPVFELFRGANRWMYLGNFGLALLAGTGFDLVRTNLVPINYYKRIEKALRWIFVLTVLGALFVNIVYWIFSEDIIRFLQGYFDKYYYEKTTKLPIAHYHNAIRSLVVNQFSNISFANYKFFVPLAFLSAAWLFFRKLAGERLNRKNAIMFCSMIIFSNLLLMHPNYIRTIPRGVLEKQPEIADFMLSKNNSADRFRIFTYLPGDAIDQKLRTPFAGKFEIADTVVFGRDMIQPNNISFDLDLIDGSSHLMSRRVGRMITFSGSNGAFAAGSGIYSKINKPDKPNELLSRLPILSMLNVKYVISAYELTESKDLPLIHTVYSTRFNIPIYLYENKTVLPRIYLANRIEYIASTDEEENFDIISGLNNDFSEKTFIECRDCQENKNILSKKDKISINEYEEGYLSLTASTGWGRWLVFSESNLPGWEVTIDTNSTRSYMANYLFHGIYVPPGEHEIKFEYVGI